MQLPGLVEAAETADRREALSEARRLELEAPDRVDAGSVAVTDARGELVAYAQMGPPGADATHPVETVVEPGHRDQATWADVFSATFMAVPMRDPLTLWTHGDDPARDAALAPAAPVLVRELWQVRIPLPCAQPPSLPDDLSVRSFRRGLDEAAWLAVNNAAFAGHPEQGGWVVRDLLDRMRQPWFDEDGFLLAWAGPVLAGFCWTKVHPASRFDPELGEIYVIATAPKFQGRGLGRGLTLAGLEHLAGRGVATGMLYVDDDNTAARDLYRSIGFVDHAVTRGWRVSPRNLSMTGYPA